MATSCDTAYGTLIASLARTADNYSEDMLNNAKFKGLLLHFSVTVNAGGLASVTPTVQYYNQALGTWATWQAAAAISAVAETAMAIYPTALAADLSLTTEKNEPLPYLWRLFMDHADANPITYSVSYQYLP